MESPNSNLLVYAPVFKKLSTEVTPEEKNCLIKSVAPGKNEISPNLGREISIEVLVNRLNFANFQDDNIRLHFVNQHSNKRLTVKAFPKPCSGLELKCQWVKSSEISFLIKSYRIDYILVPWGERFIHFVPEAMEINEHGCCLRLPKTSHEFSRRRFDRHHCKNISVHLSQENSSFSGVLFDFSASSFRVDFSIANQRRFVLIDVKKPVIACINHGSRTLFSGECSILRVVRNRHTFSYILESINNDAPNYQKAEFRSERQELRPSPNLSIRHPLTQKRLTLRVVDLSGSGLSVEEEINSSSLLPGLLIPDAELNFAGIFKMPCVVKVVFRRSIGVDDNAKRVRCGLSFIAVEPKDHIKLLGILDQLKYQNAFICNNVELDALWDFLFETGFIYPKKYALIEKRKNEIKQIYSKLYINCPDIARHFVYQDNGRILGHMATVRFWENAWLIHHHAARKSAQKKAGLIVLDQIGRFCHNTFRLQEMHMEHLVCYYRPQNRFPNRIFGGVARHINDPKGCSLDLFAFINRPMSSRTAIGLPRGWELSPGSEIDIRDLEVCYQKLSGGLMLKAFNLESSNWTDENICAEFRNHGFRRERYLLTLKKDRDIKAILIINISDLGLNLSSLTHCINALILDPKGLSPEVLFSSFHLTKELTGQPDLPALIFPMSYVENNSIPFDKVYCLWVCHMRSQSQTYFRYVNRLLKYV